MRFLGNIIWLLLGGLATAVEYFVASILMMITIIGIPFGVQSMKMATLCIWPFGAEVEKKQTESGCINSIMNVLWFFLGGIWIMLTHFLFGILLTITIIGIPWGRQHFKLAAIALSPFGREIKY